jgi:hypothetical protein
MEVGSKNFVDNFETQIFTLSLLRNRNSTSIETKEIQCYNSRFIEFYFHAIFTINVLMCGLQTFIPITYINY